jgi:hypothetical protein
VIVCCGGAKRNGKVWQQKAGTLSVEWCGRAAVDFEVIIVHPGPSAAATNDNSLLLLGTTELHLKKTAAAGLCVIVSP